MGMFSGALFKMGKEGTVIPQGGRTRLCSGINSQNSHGLRALAIVSHKMARILAHPKMLNYSAVGFARKRTARLISRVRGAGGKLATNVAP